MPRLLRIRRRSFQGAGLILVILVGSLILTVGLALGTLCTLNLNFARQDLLNQQFRLMAKAGQDQMVSVLTQRGGLKIGMPNPAQPQLSVPPLLATICPSPLFDTKDGLPGRCEVTFDQTQPDYSFDNTQSELDGFGYNGRVVPPFSADIIFKLTIGSTVRYYESILTQRWQYDAFCGSGTVDTTNGAVEGSIFSNQTGGGGTALVTVGTGSSQVTGDACTQALFDPASIVGGAPNLKGRKRYNVKLVNVPLGTSPADQLGINTSGAFSPTLPAGPTNGGPLPWWHGGPAPKPVLVPPAPLPGPNVGGLDLSAIVNAAYVTVTVTSSPGPGEEPVVSTNFFVWLPDLGKNDPSIIMQDAAAHRLYFMTKDVGVHPDSAGHTQFAIQGSLFNHAFLYQVPFDPMVAPASAFVAGSFTPTGVETTAAGTLTITDSVLSMSGCGDFTDIQGNNAALYVGGTLRLAGGNMNSNDKGMVITAKGIELDCGGTFNGFISSTEYIDIEEVTAKSPLQITGGLLCDTGRLRVGKGVTIKYGPKYTKVLNQFAPVEPILFQQLAR